MTKYYCTNCDMYWDDPKDHSPNCPCCNRPGNPRERVYTEDEMRPASASPPHILQVRRGREDRPAQRPIEKTSKVEKKDEAPPKTRVEKKDEAPPETVQAEEKTPVIAKTKAANLVDTRLPLGLFYRSDRAMWDVKVLMKRPDEEFEAWCKRVPFTQGVGEKKNQGSSPIVRRLHGPLMFGRQEIRLNKCPDINSPRFCCWSPAIDSVAGFPVAPMERLRKIDTNIYVCEMPLNQVFNTHRLQVEEATNLVQEHLKAWRNRADKKVRLMQWRFADQLFALSGLEVVIPYVPPENVICVVPAQRSWDKGWRGLVDKKLSLTKFKLLVDNVVWNRSDDPKKRMVLQELAKFKELTPAQSVRRMISDNVNNIKQIISSEQLQEGIVIEEKKENVSFVCNCVWCIGRSRYATEIDATK